MSRLIDDGSQFFISDLDRDGNDDLLIDRGVALLWLRIHGQNFFPKNDGNFQLPGKVLGIFDANGDGYADFFVLMETPDGYLVACHDWYSVNGASEPLYTLGPFLPERPRNRAWNEGSVDIMDCFDADDNGKPEIYLSINTNYAKPEPRSLRVYDGPGGHELWRFDMGPHLKNLKLLAMPGGDARIIVSSFAPNNGAVWNETSDSFSYVFCIHVDGELDWVKPVAGKHAWNSIDVADFDRDGVQEILVARYFGPEEESADNEQDLWSVAVIDPSDADITRAAYLDTGIDQVYPVDLDRDFFPEVLAVGMDGRLFLLNSDLSTREIIDSPPHRTVHGVTDLDRDGFKEIICSGPGRLMIRNELGNLEAEKTLNEPFTVALADFQAQRHLVAQSDNVVHFLKFGKSVPFATTRGILDRFRSSPKGSLVLLALGVGIGALCLLAIIYVPGRLRQRRGILAPSEETHNDLLRAMAAFDHGGASLKVLDRLRLHLKNWDRMLGAGARVNRSFDQLVETFEGSVVPDLQNISVLAKRAGISSQGWHTAIADLPAVTKTLVSLRNDGLREHSESNAKRLQAALADLYAIDEFVTKIDEHLHYAFRTPIVSTLGTVIRRRKEELDAAGVVPRLAVVGACDDHAFMSQPLLEKVFDGLLANALRAMEGKPSPRLEVVVQSQGSSCTMDFSDGGCGIPEEDWERIFDRQYTTKEEGGFGLFFSREELSKFGGKIFVQKSDSRDGTTFRIALRKS